MLASASPHLPTSAVADTRQVNYAAVVQLGSAVAVGANAAGYTRQRERSFFGNDSGRDELGGMTQRPSPQKQKWYILTAKGLLRAVLKTWGM